MKTTRGKVSVAMLVGVLALTCLSPRVCAQASDFKAAAEADFLKLKAAAERGDPEAQWKFGLYYEQDSNHADAIKWFRKAADQGDTDAQVALGVRYFDGFGIEKDYVAAAEWFQKAAAQGDGFALLRLGECYRDGKGVKVDRVQAYALFNLAASSPMSASELRDLSAEPDPKNRRITEQGYNREGALQRDAIEKKMPPEQVLEAQRLSKQMRAQIDATAKGSGSQNPNP